ncbi:hypothetical protein FVEN_g8068 [Fusarium venenatum]|nr:hypothetical protein FVEN_g8068 [Fusarium venenatum]
MQITTFVASVILAAGQATAVINCKDSSGCGTTPNSVGDLINLGEHIDLTRWYNSGEHIVCADNLCAFLQDTVGLPGSELVPLLKNLSDRGCKKCGSVPILSNDDDETSQGILIVNFVANPQCKWAACKK